MELYTKKNGDYDINIDINSKKVDNNKLIYEIIS